MSLMKSFNRNYMIQNLKKSKSVLAFFLGILPIISVLSYLALAKNVSLDSITLETISIIHYFGIYFIPVILSVCLFGFVYRKKSVDFINSMPLSRKTIFTTNTMTGILLLLLMVVLSGFGIYITSILTNTIMPFRMIADYILMWSISYIFVFILSNIAMSISGNAITQVVATLLLLFFIPFLTDYVTDGNMYLGYDYHELCIESTTSSPYGDEVCNMIENIEETNYTTPYNNVRVILSGNWNKLYNLVSLMKMLIISLIGYIVGKYLFLKRKMENNEISFKNLEMHNVIKALTMFPMIALISIMVPDSNISGLIVIFIVLFLLVYFFIYDLITRKSISNIRKSLIHFCIILVVLFPICIAIHINFHNDSKTTHINIKDNEVTGIQISLNTASFSQFEYLDIKDKKDITNILEKVNNGVNSSSSSMIYKEILIKTQSHDYKVTARFLEDDYNEIISSMTQNDDIQNTEKLFNQNKIYAIGFEDSYIKNYTNNSKIIDAARKAIKENSTCQDNYKFNRVLSIYAYDDGDVISYQLNSCLSNVLNDYVEEVINKKNKEFLDKVKGMSYTNASYMITFDIDEYNISSIQIDYDEMADQINSNTKAIYSFIKKYTSDTFNVEKEYIALTGFLDGEEYVYYTNRIDEFLDVIGIEKEDLNDIN